MAEGIYERVLERVAQLEAERDHWSERAQRAERLIERYRRPMPDRGLTARERIATAKVRMDDSEARADDLGRELEALHRDATERLAEFAFLVASYLEQPAQFYDELRAYLAADPARPLRTASR